MRKPWYVLVPAAACLFVLHTPVVFAPPPNESPRACFTVDPISSTVLVAFTVDGSCSSDDRTPLSKLKFRWNWDGGGYDTPFTTNPIATHTYPSEGLMTIILEVQDQQGLTSTAGLSVRVNP